MNLMNKPTVRRLLHASESDSFNDLHSTVTAHFQDRYPKASRQDLFSIGDLVYALVTGMVHSPAGNLTPLEAYVRAVVAGSLGGKVLPNGMWDLSNAPDRVQTDPSDEQTEFLFNLIETLYFKTKAERAAVRRFQLMDRGGFNVAPTLPESEEDKRQTIQEAIDLLEATRSAFKSKLIMQAKDKLKTLL